MRRLVVGCTAAAFILGLSLNTWAQTDEEKRDKKLGKEWVKKGGWITDYDKAREAAKGSSKLILAYFTRSYSF